MRRDWKKQTGEEQSTHVANRPKVINQSTTQVFHHPAHRPFVFMILTVFGIGFCIVIARAAPLSFSTAENITLTSPTTTFTIATGSVAGALQVNATNVMVTLSSSTGGSFTLTSASYGLTIASSSSGGTASLACTSGTASLTLFQSASQTTYTITPTASQCTTPSNSGGSSGGNGGGGVSVGVAASYAPPNWQIGSPLVTGTPLTASSSAVTTTVSVATSSVALEAQLQSLLALLANLEAQAEKKGIAAPGTAATPPLITSALHLGMSGQNVTRLQEFLATDSAIYPEGKVSGYFGTLTLQAVQRFQKQYGIAKAGDRAYGYVGPATRAKLNSLIEEGMNP
jgi:hypothetical protein